MAVRIRMTRTGRLNRPFYSIGVFDSRTRRDGRVIEQLGYYDPLLSTGTEWKVDQDRLAFWMGRGALPSERITRGCASRRSRSAIARRATRASGAREGPPGGAPSHRPHRRGDRQAGRSRGSPAVRRAEEGRKKAPAEAPAATKEAASDASRRSSSVPRNSDRCPSRRAARAPARRRPRVGRAPSARAAHPA